MNLTKVFEDSIKGNKNYQIAEKIIKENASGGMWVVGGFVYRNISSIIYDSKKPSGDIDFVVENIAEKIKVPKGWEITKNKFGNPKIKKGKNEIDISILERSHFINRKKIKPTIKNYLKGVPFTVQSIAYDIRSRKIIGKVGIKSIKEKSIGVNNLDQAKYCLPIQGRTYKKWVKEMAKSLGFKLILKE